MRPATGVSRAGARVDGGEPGLLRWLAVPAPPASPAPVTWTGYLLVAAAAALWGSLSVVAKLLLTSGISPITLVSVRSFLAFLLLTATLALAAPGLLRIGWRDLPYLAVLGTLGFALTNGTYYFVLTQLPVATALLLQYTSPLLVLGASALLWGEPVRRRDLGGALLALGGCALVVRVYEPEALRVNALGVAAGLFGACVFAFYTMWSKLGTRRFAPWTMLVYALAFSAAAWLPVSPPWRFLLEAHPGWVWASVAMVVVAGTILPFGLYLAGLARLSAAHANLTSSLELLVAAVTAFLVLGETLAGASAARGRAHPHRHRAHPGAVSLTAAERRRRA